jgi:hypothetical protein
MSDDAPAELTDEKAVEVWLKIAEKTDVLIGRIQDPTSFAVQSNSALAGDDAVSHPYRVSHCARQALNAGMDHMHALKSLILDAPQILHAASDFSLIRGALENFAVAYWVLHPLDRVVRVERALRCAAQNFCDGDSATKYLGLPKEYSLESNLASVGDVGRRAGCDKNKVKRRLSSTAILQFAAEQTSIQPSPLLMWQLCSGFAHGRQWANLAMNAMELTPTSEEDLKSVRFTTDYKRLLGAGWPASKLMTAAADLLTERSAAN